MSRTVLRACAAGLMITAMAGSAFAEPPASVATGQVKINDLDLNTPQGARVLFHRVSATAATLCAQTDTPVLPRAEHEIWRCRAQTIAKAVARLNAPRLTAEYIRQFGTPATLVAAR